MLESERRIHELSAVAKDAFIVLKGATKIQYRDGDAWDLEDGEDDHPVVHKLRAASMEALIGQPPASSNPADRDIQAQLKEERRINDDFRTFLVSLDAICHDAGMDRETRGQEVLSWIRNRLIG
jgi:hypothetical protein